MNKGRHHCFKRCYSFRLCL